MAQVPADTDTELATVEPDAEPATDADDKWNRFLNVLPCLCALRAAMGKLSVSADVSGCCAYVSSTIVFVTY